MESVSPSNHQTTAAKLRRAGIRLKRTRQQQPLYFDTEWKRFASLCGSTTVNATTAWTALQGTISGSYSGELAFDIRLYGDVMALLGGSVQRASDRLYLLSNNTTIGIARQVQRENDLGFHPDYGLTTDAIHDHAVVLVSQSNIIVDEMSLVELKTDATNCRTFPVRNDKVLQVNLSKEHGALGQALIYTAGDLINCLARRGIVESDLEILVLSGKKQNRTGGQRLCYVRGCLAIPRFCGQPFYFSVLDFEAYNDQDAEKHGLAAYFNTISNGIERARRAVVNPTPLCGRAPKVANFNIPLNLVGSPIPRLNLEFAVSQGEIFRANLSAVLPAEADFLLWTIDNKKMLLQIQQNQAVDESVLVKFGCQAVHQHFVPPGVAFAALQHLHKQKHMRAALSDVLLGVWQINTLSVVTITKELVDFGPIKPQELTQPGEMQTLWNGFIDLNEKVLIPMAEMTVVYADMRPGWTETSNILRKRLQDGTEVLKLIDYESVCRVEEVPENFDDKTFCAAYDDSVDDANYTALRHLWWQCVFTAYTWAMRLDIVKGTFDASIFVEDFQSNDLDAQFWGNVDHNEVENIANQPTITAQMVLRTLRILSRVPGLSII